MAPQKPKDLQPIEKEEDIDSGGKSGKIEFRFKDPLAGPVRDDLLPPNEIKRLLIVHKEIHKDRVTKQKTLRAERAAIKEGRYVSSMDAKFTQGFSGGTTRYKTHPISKMAQFSGIDKQVIGIPTLNEADTNPEAKEALENRYENKYQNKPRFNPRPRFPGS